MTYPELKEKMKEFLLGNISKMELACAVHLWQRAEGFNPVEKELATMKNYVGKQLATRDGKITGNSIIIKKIREKNCPIENQNFWIILTDFGNTAILNDSEISELFFDDYSFPWETERYNILRWATKRISFFKIIWIWIWHQNTKK